MGFALRIYSGICEAEHLWRGIYSISQRIPCNFASGCLYFLIYQSKLRSGSLKFSQASSIPSEKTLVEALNLNSEEDPISDEFTDLSEDYWAEYDLIILEMRIA